MDITFKEISKDQLTEVSTETDFIASLRQPKTPWLLYTKNERQSLFKLARDENGEATFLHYDVKGHRSMPSDLSAAFETAHVRPIDVSGNEGFLSVRRFGVFRFQGDPSLDYAAGKLQQPVQQILDEDQTVKQYRETMAKGEKVLADIKSGRAAEEFAKKKVVVSPLWGKEAEIGTSIISDNAPGRKKSV